MLTVTLILGLEQQRDDVRKHKRSLIRAFIARLQNQWIL